MSGTNVVFDTNALVNFFNGHPNLQRYVHSTVTLSIISVLEFLAYPEITKEDEARLFRFLKKVNLVNLESANVAWTQQIIEIRKKFKLKLPDAIIAATAVFQSAEIITNDKDFTKVPGLNVTSY